ncbi:hypothetical protein QFC20_005711 [Naganishia adeliensis]|uniref:Uncharacterized protein n=1 Tax=Naganishia adeliensis TaxID=92952 RepID=A0ACC2VK78_9TREE|nr:hypothetical protein QFC20_005711 [Naganishia adeliensis]
MSADTTDIIDLTGEWHAIVSDHEDNPAPEPESTTTATLHDDNNENTMPDALESPIVRAWLQRHQGSDAARGGEEPELELEMREVSEDGNEAKDAEKDGEEEEDEQQEEEEEVPEEH